MFLGRCLRTCHEAKNCPQQATGLGFNSRGWATTAATTAAAEPHLRRLVSVCWHAQDVGAPRENGNRCKTQLFVLITHPPSHISGNPHERLWVAQPHDQRYQPPHAVVILAGRQPRLVARAQESARYSMFIGSVGERWCACDCSFLVLYTACRSHQVYWSAPQRTPRQRPLQVLTLHGRDGPLVAEHRSKVRLNTSWPRQLEESSPGLCRPPARRCQPWRSPLLIWACRGTAKTSICYSRFGGSR